jgi:hypothetical protein
MAARAAGSSSRLAHHRAETFRCSLHQGAADLGFSNPQAVADDAIRGDVEGGHAIKNPGQKAMARSSSGKDVDETESQLHSILAARRSAVYPICPSQLTFHQISDILLVQQVRQKLPNVTSPVESKGSKHAEDDIFERNGCSGSLRYCRCQRGRHR